MELHRRELARPLVRRLQFFERHKIAEGWGTSAVEVAVEVVVEVAVVSADLLVVEVALVGLLEGLDVDIRRMVVVDMVAAVAWDVVDQVAEEAVTMAGDDLAWLELIINYSSYERT